MLMYATSTDGINWTKNGTILSDEGVVPNTVMKDEGIYKMWYQKDINDNWTIFFATSFDGISWTKHGKVLTVGAPGEPDDKHVTGAAVVKEDDGTYMMWYSGHDDENGYKIFHATSGDGKNWIKKGVVIEAEKVGNREEAQTGYPNVIRGEKGYYKMWYNSPVNAYDMSIMYAVSAPSITTSGYLVTKPISLPPDQTWDRLLIDKTESGEQNQISISILDGTTHETIPGYENLKGTEIPLLSIENHTPTNIQILVTFEGDGSNTPVLNELKVTWVKAPEPNREKTEDNNWSNTVIAITTGIVLTSLFFTGGSEIGRYRIFPLFPPFYTRLKKDEVLNQETRMILYRYILEHPGDHYNGIKDSLHLNNGACAYHLKTLEREGYIKSMRDGIYRRFYPVNTKVPRVNGFGIKSVQGQIIMQLIQHPGLTQREISNALGISQQSVSYHLNILMETGHIRLFKKEKKYHYYVNELIPRTNM
jgi:DNA-binding MarR family transcriptional regulator